MISRRKFESVATGKPFKASANPRDKNSPLYRVKVLVDIPPGAITQPELKRMAPPGFHRVAVTYSIEAL